MNEFIIYKKIYQFTYYLQLIEKEGQYRMSWTGIIDNAYKMGIVTMEKHLNYLRDTFPDEEILSKGAVYPKDPSFNIFGYHVNIPWLRKIIS